MSDSAVLEAPVSEVAPAAAEAPPKSGDRPSGEATPASERNGKHESNKTEERARIKKEFSERRSNRSGSKAEATAETPAAETKRDESGRFASDKPKAPQTPAEHFDEATLTRAENAGITRYAAKKLGDVAKLNAEIDRREAAARRHQEEAARQPAEQPAPKAEARVEPQQAPKAETTESAEDKLAKLGDLSPEYGELADYVKTLRDTVQQVRDENRELRSLRDEVSGLKSRAQQDEEARLGEAIRKDASEFDAMVADLGEEFTPIYGKGGYENLPPAYAAERKIPFEITRALREAYPETLGQRPLKDIAKVVVGLFYPDEFTKHQERALYQRAQANAKTRGAPASTAVTVSAPSNYTGPSKGDPEIQAKVREIQLRRQGLSS